VAQDKQKGQALVNTVISLGVQ